LVVRLDLQLEQGGLHKIDASDREDGYCHNHPREPKNQEAATLQAPAKPGHPCI
jgi:hypothetical protein